MTFNILDFIDQLEPDGGTNNPRGDHSFKCPACGAPNFKVNVVTGKWFSYGCDCASTEAGKRAIREALSPARPPGQDRLNLQVRSTAPQGFAVKSPPKPEAKPASKKAIRPHQKREWRYDSKEGSRSSRSIARTMARGTGRSGNDRWSIDSPLVMFSSSLFRTTATSPLLDLQQGAPFVFWVEGEPCADALGAGAP